METGDLVVRAETVVALPGQWRARRILVRLESRPALWAPNAADTESSETDDSTVLREERAGEVSKADVGNGSDDELSSILDDLDDGDRKHDDPQAEYAHRKAQQRDPRDVVELGETISLVIKEAEFTSGSPPVMGTKNNLGIFVTDPPRHISKYDTIRAKIVDFGGNDTSAEAAFLGYAD